MTSSSPARLCAAVGYPGCMGNKVWQLKPLWHVPLDHRLTVDVGTKPAGMHHSPLNCGPVHRLSGMPPQH